MERNLENIWEQLAEDARHNFQQLHNIDLFLPAFDTILQYYRTIFDKDAKIITVYNEIRYGMMGFRDSSNAQFPTIIAQLNDGVIGIYYKEGKWQCVHSLRNIEVYDEYWAI